MQFGFKVPHFQAVPEAKGEFLGALYPDGSFKYFAPAFKSLTGEDPFNWNNRPLIDFVHPESIENVEEAFQSLYEGDTVHLPYLCAKQSNGELCILDLTLVPCEVRRQITEILIFGTIAISRELANSPLNEMQKTDPQAKGFLCQRTKSQGTLESFFEQILANAPLGFCFLNRALRFTCVNERFAEIYGYHPDQFLGRSTQELFPAVSEQVEEALRKVLSTGQMLTDVEITLYSRCKPTYTVQSFYPIITENHITGIGCLIVEITERKKMEEALSRTAAELSRSNEDLQRFAYAASHDLKEPLRMVNTYIQLLERKNHEHLDEDSVLYLKFIQEGASRMKCLIDDLLGYSSISKSEFSVSEESSERILERALANLSLTISENNASINYADLPKIVCDPSQMLQLFQNLISNSLKYRKTESPKISVSATFKGNEWIFSVKDNGIGIDMRYSDHIFDLFKRLHTRQEFAGTGIGLATCKRIVELQGGKIWVDSQPGVGSTFSFTVPAKGKTSPQETLL